ncbi:hypothetical protein [Streptomyces boluensis]|uniref:Uncharacterized protein n=1 Tax=Streptomyces boluensis TaxID=1775135 RepID=A0A964UWR9_9ACTN|nr:hypothetical protein [Streptomyces boluensis]
MHLYYCPDAPRGGVELNLDQALTELVRPGSRACTECGAAAALLPLLGTEPETGDTPCCPPPRAARPRCALLRHGPDTPSSTTRTRPTYPPRTGATAPGGAGFSSACWSSGGDPAGHAWRPWITGRVTSYDNDCTHHAMMQPDHIAPIGKVIAARISPE